MHLYDAHGRKINYLRISLTDRCNLQCFYCRKDNITFYKRDEILTLEEIEFLISIFYRNFGVKKIRFTGGEPLLRRGIEKLIGGMKNLNLSINITTNGILLGEFAEFLSKNGVSVNVSLDTLSPEKFKRIAGSYDLERVIDGIDKSIELGIKLKINTVLLRGVNDSEIFDLIDFAFSRGIEIRFIEFMPFVDELVWREYFISEDEIRNKIEEKHKLFKVGDGDSVASYYVLDNGAKVGFISTVSKPFCHTCSRVRITSDGSLVLCMFDKFSYPLKRFLRPEPREEELVRFVSSIAKLKPKGFIEFKERQASFQMISLGG